jgi:hypothetical protein
VSSEQADSCLATLKAQGYPHSQVIGRVVQATDGIQPIAIASIYRSSVTLARAKSESLIQTGFHHWRLRHKFLSVCDR